MAEKTRAQIDQENEEKQKAKDKDSGEEKQVALPGDEEYVPEDEREHTLPELEGRLHAAEAHERLANQVQKEDYQEEQRREQIAQGPELAEKAREEYEEAHDEQQKLEKAMREKDSDALDITKSKAPSSDKTRSDKASDK